jgi:hypothetical protein
MPNVRAARFIVPMVMAALLVAACQQDSSQSSTYKTSTKRKGAPVVKKGPSAQQQTAGMVTAASPGHSNIPLSLKFDLEDRPAVGHALEIEIALLPQLSATAGTLQIADSAGIDVAAAAAQTDIPAIEPDQVYRSKILVTPNREGVLFLNIVVSVKHDEQTDSRSFSIPIIVSPAEQVAAVPPAH